MRKRKQPPYYVVLWQEMGDGEWHVYDGDDRFTDRKDAEKRAAEIYEEEEGRSIRVLKTIEPELEITVKATVKIKED